LPIYVMMHPCLTTYRENILTKRGNLSMSSMPDESETVSVLCERWRCQLSATERGRLYSLHLPAPYWMSNKSHASFTWVKEISSDGFYSWFVALLCVAAPELVPLHYLAEPGPSLFFFFFFSPNNFLSPSWPSVVPSHVDQRRLSAGA